MLVNIVLIGFASILSIPLMVIGLELFIFLLHKRASSKEETDARGTYKILIPAHNEAGIIKKTLSALIQQGIAVDDIIVVADNCMDATANLAKDFGVTVLERMSDENKGKGFALDHGICYLKDNSFPDVLIILDADCEMSKASIIKSVNSVMLNDRPVQVTNLMRVVNKKSFSQRIAGFAWLVKNKVRPIAVNKVGLPVTLTGTGMVFPWHVISTVNIAHGSIVEDMQLGIDCALDGFAPLFCEQAIVYSDFPEKVEAEKTQRTRWEHGHLMTIFQQVPMLVKQAIVQKNWQLLGLALDMCVPPLALLVMLSIVELGLFILAGYLVGVYTSFLILLTSFMFFAAMLVMVWWKDGRDYLTLKEISGIPIYILSKVSIYEKFIFNRQKLWVKTSRDTQE